MQGKKLSEMTQEEYEKRIKLTINEPHNNVIEPDRIRERYEVLIALVEFTKRVANGEATPEEVQVLPEIAKIVMGNY